MMAPQSQVFRREGEYWTLVFAAATCRLRDTLGLHDIACLLSRPRQQVSAIEILAARPNGGGTAPADDPAARERARVNVTRAISAALKRIAEHHPHLGEHLRATIRTGYLCGYTPDPRLPTEWEV